MAINYRKSSLGFAASTIFFFNIWDEFKRTDRNDMAVIPSPINPPLFPSNVTGKCMDGGRQARSRKYNLE